MTVPGCPVREFSAVTVNEAVPLGQPWVVMASVDSQLSTGVPSGFLYRSPMVVPDGSGCGPSSDMSSGRVTSGNRMAGTDFSNNGEPLGGDTMTSYRPAGRLVTA